MMLDILLICALKDEYDQVLAVTDGLLGPGWVQSLGPNGWIVADGSFATSTGSLLSIRTTWASHMGRERAQAVTSMLIQEQPARCIAMSGICAGRRGKVALGDVIFADRLWSFDAGKLIVEDEAQCFQGDTFPYRLRPTTWVQRMQQLSIPTATSWLAQRPLLPLELQEDWAMLRVLAGDDPRRDADFNAACPDWSIVLSRLWKRKWLNKPLTITETGREYAVELEMLYPRGLPTPKAFQIHVAPIATGASVTEDTDIFPRLANSMRTVLGLEMEASALGSLGEMLEVPVVVAKGVSDYGDAFKDDRYRHFAARAAAECLITLLRNSADLLPSWNTMTLTHPNEVRDTPSAYSPCANRPNIEVPRELILMLAEEYPDVKDARFLWARAGGKASEVENISRPQDLWQRLWVRSIRGASVRPEALLRAALEDLPGNPVLLSVLKMLG